MGQQWTQKCKDCGKCFGYSDLSMQLDMKKGLSKPERCPEHRKQHAVEINTISSSHFSLKPIKGKSSILGTDFIGEIYHEERIPEVEFREPDSSGMDIGMNEEHLKLIYPSLERNKVLIIVAPTGSGKSTYLPTKLLYPEFGIDVDHFTKHGPIVVTQPRILATSGIANSIAEKFVGTKVGPGYDIGYSHGKRGEQSKSYKSKSNETEDDEIELDENKLDSQRVMQDDRKFSSDKIISGEFYDRRNRLLIVTDGKLINTIANGRISEYGIVFIDEAHERSMNIDFILASLRNELIKYKHLKLIVASATIDANAFADFFKEVNLSTDIIDLSECRKKSIYEEMDWKFSDLTPDELKTPYDDVKAEIKLRIYEKNIIEQLANKIYSVYDEINYGDILGFLHGSNEIDECIRLLKIKFKSSKSVLICPLHAKVSEHQKAAYEKHEKRQKDNKQTTDKNYKIRAIYIGTNQAETSLTFANLVSVVDTGLIKQSGWNPHTCRSELRSRFHSKDGCKQRWGRVGRTEKGYVFKLYSQEYFVNYFPQHTVPEISRGNMEDVIVKAKASGINDISAQNFGWLDKPNQAEVDRATNLFKERNLTDDEYDFTDYGREVYTLASRLSVFLSEIDRDSPNRTLDIAGLLILADKYGCLIEAATLIVMMPHLGENSFADTKKIERGKNVEGIFLWNYKWDLKSKYVISKLHEEIKSGCIDDLDFSCKLFSLFEKSVSVITDCLYSEWVNRYFINEINLHRVIDAREDLLEFFIKGKKTDSNDLFRAIDFSKISVLRFLITIAWPDRKRTICKEDNRNILIDEKNGIKGFASRLSAFNSLGGNSVIVGMFDSSDVTLNSEIRESPVGSFLIDVFPTHLNNKSSVYELLLQIKSIKENYNAEKTISRLFSHLQAPFNSKITFNNRNQTSWEIIREEIFIPKTIEGISTDAFFDNKEIYDDTALFKKKTQREKVLRNSIIKNSNINVTLTLKTNSDLLTGFISNWTITKDGENICELIQSANSVIVKNEDNLKNKETLICELRQPIYDLPVDKLIGFIAEDEFGQLRTVSALNLSIQPNNLAILNYINRKLELKYLPESKNLHDDFCLSLLGELEQDLVKINNDRSCNGYVYEIQSDRVKFILMTNKKYYHACYLNINHWRVKGNLKELKLNRELLFFISKQEQKKEPIFRVPAGKSISNLHSGILSRLKIKDEDGRIIVSLPFTYNKFLTILKTLPFTYSEIRNNYSDTNSIYINDFIFPERWVELNNRYQYFITAVNEGNANMRELVESFEVYLKANAASIPEIIKEFVWKNVKRARPLKHLEGKEKTLLRWKESIISTKNESRKIELADKIVHISQEIKELKSIKLETIPY